MPPSPWQRIQNFGHPPLQRVQIKSVYHTLKHILIVFTHLKISKSSLKIFPSHLRPKLSPPLRCIQIFRLTTIPPDGAVSPISLILNLPLISRTHFFDTAERKTEFPHRKLGTIPESGLQGAQPLQSAEYKCNGEKIMPHRLIRLNDDEVTETIQKKICKGKLT